MSVREVGMSIDARLIQFANALFPIVLSDLGKVTVERLDEFENASSPIEMTELGIIIDFRYLLSAKAPWLIDVTLYFWSPISAYSGISASTTSIEDRPLTDAVEVDVSYE